MAIADNALSRIKRYLKPDLRLREGVRESSKKLREQVQEENASEISKEELRKRYSNARVGAYVTLGAALYAGVHLVVFPDLLGRVYSSLVLALSALIYCSISFRLWMAREKWKNWGLHRTHTWSMWIDAIKIRPSEIFPGRLEKK